MKLLRSIGTVICSIALSACSEISTSPNHSSLNYDPNTALECPKESATDHYIEVPLMPDLAVAGARVENIPELAPNPHASLLTAQPLLKKYKVKVYYELAKPFDPSKEIFFLQEGGPGGDHRIMHDILKVSPELADKFNVVAMDHRGVGCSKPLFPGDFPYQSLLMRYAAADIEAIRLDLGGADMPINFFGRSYGTMLGQTYALLYPTHLKKIILQSAFSEAEHFDIAQAKFESLAIGTIPGQLERYNAIKAQHPELAKRFVLWSVRAMYSYKGRVQTVPEKFDQFETAVQSNDLKKATELTVPERFVMPWMTRSIACVEIFKLKTLYEDEFQMFPYNFETCSEFDGSFEHFNYTKNLKNLGARTMIMGGIFDLVTPIEAMQQMARVISDNFFYVDMHLSHTFMEKKDCFRTLINAFLDGANDGELRRISLQSKCTLPPKLD